MEFKLLLVDTILILLYTLFHTFVLGIPLEPLKNVVSSGVNIQSDSSDCSEILAEIFDDSFLASAEHYVLVHRSTNDEPNDDSTDDEILLSFSVLEAETGYNIPFERMTLIIPNSLTFFDLNDSEHSSLDPVSFSAENGDDTTDTVVCLSPIEVTILVFTDVQNHPNKKIDVVLQDLGRDLLEVYVQFRLNNGTIVEDIVQIYSTPDDTASSSTLSSDYYNGDIYDAEEQEDNYSSQDSEPSASTAPRNTDLIMDEYDDYVDEPSSPREKRLARFRSFSQTSNNNASISQLRHGRQPLRRYDSAEAARSFKSRIGKRGRSLHGDTGPIVLPGENPIRVLPIGTIRRGYSARKSNAQTYSRSQLAAARSAFEHIHGNKSERHSRKSNIRSLSLIPKTMPVLRLRRGPVPRLHYKPITRNLKISFGHGDDDSPSDPRNWVVRLKRGPVRHYFYKNGTLRKHVRSMSSLASRLKDSPFPMTVLKRGHVFHERTRAGKARLLQELRDFRDLPELRHSSKHSLSSLRRGRHFREDAPELPESQQKKAGHKKFISVKRVATAPYNKSIVDLKRGRTLHSRSDALQLKKLARKMAKEVATTTAPRRRLAGHSKRIILRNPYKEPGMSLAPVVPDIFLKYKDKSRFSLPSDFQKQRMKREAPSDKILESTFLYRNFTLEFIEGVASISHEQLVELSRFKQYSKEIYAKFGSDSLLSPDHIYTGCEANYSCFTYPSGCYLKRHCSVAMSFHYKDERLHVALLASTSNYIAVGFSKDPHMGNEPVVTCKRAPGTDRVSVWASYNIGGVSRRDNVVNVYDESVKIVSSSLQNGVLTCEFSVPRKFHLAKRGTVNFKGNKYYILMAVGTDNREPNGPGSLSYHGWTVVTRKAVDLSSTTYVEIENETNYMLTIHTVLAILTYGFLVPMAILLARYGQQAFPYKSFRGYPQWVILHIIFQVATVILNTLIVILMYIGRSGSSFTSFSSAFHLIIGTLLGVAVLVNAVVGYFLHVQRAKKMILKPGLKWSHYLIGHFIFACGSIELIRGAYLRKSQLCCSFAVIAGFSLLFHFCTHVLLIFNTDYLRRVQDNDTSFVRAFIGPALHLNIRSPRGEYDVRRGTIVFMYFLCALLTLSMILVVILSSGSCNPNDPDYIYGLF